MRDTEQQPIDILRRFTSDGAVPPRTPESIASNEAFMARLQAGEDAWEKLMTPLPTDAIIEVIDTYRDANDVLVWPLTDNAYAQLQALKNKETALMQRLEYEHP